MNFPSYASCYSKSRSLPEIASIVISGPGTPKTTGHGKRRDKEHSSRSLRSGPQADPSDEQPLLSFSPGTPRSKLVEWLTHLHRTATLTAATMLLGRAVHHVHISLLASHPNKFRKSPLKTIIAYNSPATRGASVIDSEIVATDAGLDHTSSRPSISKRSGSENHGGR